MTQTDIFDDGYPAGFWNWLARNKPIYNDFAAKALAISRRRDHYSARAILHVIRYETALKDSEGVVKINNIWSPGMARLFMEEHPELRGFFKTRNSQGLDE